MSQPTYRKIRIFIASPSDVTPERDRLRKVVEELDQTRGDELGIVLRTLDWRDLPPGMGRPQQLVFNNFPPETWDIFVGILWSRFGAPSGANAPDAGRPFSSGTEEEFWSAYRLWRETGRPQMQIYRCVRNIPYKKIDPDQLSKVQKFFSEFAPGGAYPGLLKDFTTTNDFETNARLGLTALLRDLKPPAPAASAATTPSASTAPSIPTAQTNPKAEEIDALRIELDQKKRRLWQLKKQAATFGIGADPSITIQIEDLEGYTDSKGNLLREGELAKLERKIKELGG